MDSGLNSANGAIKGYNATVVTEAAIRTGTRNHNPSKIPIEPAANVNMASLPPRIPANNATRDLTALENAFHEFNQSRGELCWNFDSYAQPGAADVTCPGIQRYPGSYRGTECSRGAAFGVKPAVALHRPIPLSRADTIAFRSTRTVSGYRIVVVAAAAVYQAAVTLAVAHPASTVVDLLDLQVCRGTEMQTGRRPTANGENYARDSCYPCSGSGDGNGGG